MTTAARAKPSVSDYSDDQPNAAHPEKAKPRRRAQRKGEIIEALTDSDDEGGNLFSESVV